METSDPESDKINIARAAIIAFVETHEMTLPAAGQIDPCPVCGEGHLRFDVFENRAIWGACEGKTPCVRWME